MILARSSVILVCMSLANIINNRPCYKIKPQSIKKIKMCPFGQFHWNSICSMTTLLLHTFTHSTEPSFRLKTNNHYGKKIGSCVNIIKNCKNFTFKVYVMSKMVQISLIFFSLNNIIFLLLKFFGIFNF